MKPTLNRSQLNEIVQMVIETLNNDNVNTVQFCVFCEAVAIVLENVSGLEFVTEDEIESVSQQCYTIFYPSRSLK